ncbi:CAP domain-containing protein [Psychrobacter glaciei]|uniref:CAP domain-containing protein n=1 Tax=Psychrobacter glaciei TaxID=619771 RepID=UPI001F05C7D3|nr:CAP domain-containing protein [Psychrobacter glaciei]MCH1782512.1 CAP domain-containing protein [Psychrobacter glaciei]
MVNTSHKNLTAVIFLTMFLTACGGGGGDSDSKSNSATPPAAIPNETATDEPSGQSDDIVSDNDASDDIVNDNDASDDIVSDNDAKAALIANNTFSLARTGCGLGGLSVDPALANIATQHAKYIKYVFANSTPTVFSAHYENQIEDIANVTGRNNPFFKGLSFTDRLIQANYRNVQYGVMENIAQSAYYSSVGNIIGSDIVADAMAKSLLAAPYHLRSLMLPGSSLTGTGMVTYKPYQKDKANNQGYVLVNHSAVMEKSKDKKVEGIFTYPCQGVSGTVTALYNETPSPVEGTGRDLRNDPIGQPIYINMPSAQTIELSNIKFHDVQRNIDVPTELLDYGQDPHKNTVNELPANEAFILPITDNLKSCNIASKKNKNCGLHGDSEYRVSFDVLVDNATLENKQFTFKTGTVNY